MLELEFIPCKQEHLRLIAPQKGDENSKLAYISADFSHVFDTYICLSAWANNKCMCAGGLIDIHVNRQVAWAFVSADAGPYMLQIVRKIRSVLNLHPCPRVEMYVSYDYEKGHRFARLCGFEVEAPRMRKSGVFGNDETLYARVR